MYDWDIRSVVLSIAALQAIVISTLLLIRNYKTPRCSDKLLAFFLLAISVTMSEHIAGWLGLYEGQWLTFFPFGETFLFAPLAYLYVKSITNSTYQWSSKEWLHFIPAMIYFTFHIVVWSYPVDKKLSILNQLNVYHWLDIQGYVNAIFFTGYLYTTIRHFRAYLRWLPNEYSSIGKLQLDWVRNFIILLALYYLVFIGFSIAGLLNWYDYNIDFWQYFMLALIIYYASITGYAYIQKYDIAFDLQKAGAQTTQVPMLADLTGASISIETVAKSEMLSLATDSKNKLSAADLKSLEALKIPLLEHLVHNKPYLDPDLSLSQLANQLEMPAYIITQVINMVLGKNFNDLINGFRVDAVIAKLKNGEHKTQTLTAIAYDCGFNSKATFNRAFKKATNTSPKAFIETL